MMDEINAPVDLSEVSQMSDVDVRARIGMIDAEIKILKSDHTQLKSQQLHMQQRIKDNLEKIQLNKQLPYLVSNVIELLDLEDDEEDDDAGMRNIEMKRKGKSLVLKTSTRQVCVSITRLIVVRLYIFLSLV